MRSECVLEQLYVEMARMMHSCYVFPVKMPVLVIAVHRFSRYSVQLINIAVISDENS